MTEDLYLKGMTIDWSKLDDDSYVREIPALKNLETLHFKQKVTFFVGENGSGKSTLLEALALADGFNAEGGSRNYRFSTHDSHSELHEALRLQRGPKKSSWGYFLRAESFYNVASQEELYATQNHPSKGYHRQSHGESFLSLLQSQVDSQGFYLLDEPEAALSPQRQLALLLRVYEQAEQGAQFIIVTHSPILLGLPGAEILSFDQGEIKSIPYEETEAYRVSHLFLTDREHVLYRLLGK